PEAVSELQRLGGQLAEAQALDKQREAELAALAGRLEQAQADAAGLRGTARRRRPRRRPRGSRPRRRCPGRRSAPDC
ncbi:MAG: hypothetical protein HY926_14340, partial [Elusimicrobia bacterium]|nr:hypothetical protein [Elusimicrobiota bacterium]